MSETWAELGTIDPQALVEARLQAHHAVQWLARAARANLAPPPDDSHTNLGWDRERAALMSHPLARSDAGPMCFGLRLAPLTLLVTIGDELLDELALDGRRDAEAGAWIDQHADASGLRAPSSAILPYVMPNHPVAAGGKYVSVARSSELAALTRWFGFADDLLHETRARVAQIGTDSTPVRCWPHHFDMATLLKLKDGDPETAPSIGIGMSPGDESYPQPYFYVSPWPRPAASALPDPPAPGHWHTKDFFAAVITAETLLGTPNRPATTRDFLSAAIAASRGLLGAS